MDFFFSLFAGLGILLAGLGVLFWGLQFLTKK
jgi:hypothetical protein